MMHSTRKPKARDKRSRQSDIMSDFENMDFTLGNFPKTIFTNELETEQDEIYQASKYLCIRRGGC